MTYGPGHPEYEADQRRRNALWRSLLNELASLGPGQRLKPLRKD